MGESDAQSLLEADLGPGVWVCIGIYLFLLMSVGVFSAYLRNRNKDQGETTGDLEDHYMASHSLGYVSMVFTVIASLISGYSFVGVASDAYLNGFVSYKWVGAIIMVMLGYAAFIPRLHRISTARGGYSSAVDLVSDRWRHHPLRISFAICQLFCTFLFMMVQFIAMGSTVQGLSNGAIPAWAGCVFLGFIMVLYESLGGMQAIAWTDVIQGVVLSFGCLFLLIVQKTVFGGLPSVVDFFLQRPDYHFMIAVPSITSQVSMLSFMFVVSTLYCYPFMMQRAFATKNEKSVRYGFGILCIIAIIIYTTSSTFGVAGRAMMVKEYDDHKLTNPDNIFGLTMRHVMLVDGTFTSANYILGSLIISAIVAALMSSADSALLAMSCILTLDIVQPYILKEASQKTLVWVGRVGSLCFTILVVGVTSYAYSHGFNVPMLAVLQQNFLTQMAPGYLSAMYIKSAKPRPMLLGFVTGVFFTLIFDYAAAEYIPAAGGAPEKYISATGSVGIAAGLPACCINCVVAFAAHFAPWFREEAADHYDRIWCARWGEILSGDLIGYKHPTFPRELIHGWFGIVFLVMIALMFCFFVPWSFEPGAVVSITAGGVPSWAAVSLTIGALVSAMLVFGNFFVWQDVPEELKQDYPGVVVTEKNDDPAEIELGETGDM